MIYYDSGKWTSMLRLHGSVLPAAMLCALPSAILAYVIEWSSQEGYLNVDFLEVLTQNDIYSGFTYVLGFSLVFRTSQAYSRYWTAATSIHEMASEWSDSCASIIAFSTVMNAPPAEVERFRHTIVRLFSLLHGMAMSEVARVEDDLPLIDVQGLSSTSLELLTARDAQGKKVHIVLSWIKTYITKQASAGMLNVPAPLLTRVFQELGAGLVKFHTAQQVVIWPFPFPYTQLNVVLIQAYILVTPLVISTWKTWPIVCALFTFISVTFLVGLNLIATELENPFGDDPNDLPVLELQKDVNTFLAMQLNPLVQEPPELLPGHVCSHKELQNKSFWFNQSLNKRLARSNTPGQRMRNALSNGMTRRDKLRAQKRWCGDPASESELSRLRAWLKCKADSVDDAIRRVSHMSEPVSAGVPLDLQSSCMQSSCLCSERAESCPWNASEEGGPNYASSDCKEEGGREEAALAQTTTTASFNSFGEQQVLIFRDFLDELRGELARHLSELLTGMRDEQALQLDQLRDEQSRHLEQQLQAVMGFCGGLDVRANSDSEEEVVGLPAASPPLTRPPLLLNPKYGAYGA